MWDSMLNSCTAMLQAPRALGVQEGFLFTLKKVCLLRLGWISVKTHSMQCAWTTVPSSYYPHLAQHTELTRPSERRQALQGWENGSHRLQRGVPCPAGQHVGSPMIQCVPSPSLLPRTHSTALLQAASGMPDCRLVYGNITRSK